MAVITPCRYSAALATEGDEAPSWRLHMSATHVAVRRCRRYHPRLCRHFQELNRSPRRRTTKSSERSGAAYGPAFQGIRSIDAAGLEVVGDLELPEAIAQDASLQLVHPALLDAAFQLIGVFLSGRRDAAGDGDMYMPIGVERYSVRIAGARSARCHARLDKFEEGADLLRAELTLFDENGAVIADVTGLVVLSRNARGAAACGQGRRRALAREDWLFELAWRASAPTQKSSHSASRPLDTACG